MSRPQSYSMGEKRKKRTTDFDGDQSPTTKPRTFKKPRRAGPQEDHSQSKSLNFIKKKIRDVSRRLENVKDLPATVRIEDERALAAYENDLAAALLAKHRKKMIERYHMVRFFERQKASRLAKKLQKRIVSAKSVEDVEALKPYLHTAEVDLNYTQFYPLLEPYSSLYPKDKRELNACFPESGESIDAIRQTKPPMWFEVERCMEAGTLQQLRDRVTDAVKGCRKGRPTRPVDKAPPVRAAGAEHDNGVSTERTESEDDGDVSDGGFFEE